MARSDAQIASTQNQLYDVRPFMSKSQIFGSGRVPLILHVHLRRDV